MTSSFLPFQRLNLDVKDLVVNKDDLLSMLAMQTNALSYEQERPNLLKHM